MDRKNKKRGRIENLTPFKKGCPGGPGRPKIPEDERQMRREIHHLQGQAKWSWQQFLFRLRGKTTAELEKMASDKTLPAEELMVIRAKMLVLSKPRVKDVAALVKLECGSDPKQLEVSGPEGEPLTPFTNVATDEVEAVVLTLLKEVRCSKETSLHSSPSSAPSAPASRPRPSRTGL